MSLEKYWEFLRKVNDLYQAGKYKEVIDFLKDVPNQYPDRKPAIYYHQICAASKLSQYDLSIQLIQEILDEGGWYSEMVLRQSPSLKPLQDIPEFEKLLKISVERSKHVSSSEHNITLIPDKTNPPYPLMLALHAGSGFIEEEFESWKTIVDQGYILGMPRSSNVFWSGKDSAYWPDHESASNQIKAYVEKINIDNTLDLERTILGGLSSGGELAIWLALTNPIPICGFIVVAPGGQWMNDPDKWKSIIKDTRNKELKGLIILGEEDKAVPHESIHQLVNMLNDRGISCQFIKYPGLGHWYPPDFTDILTSFTNEINSGKR
ncbi:MAG: dienelactone hydrolase family protein [Candidatus Hodarchaeota archaeon]